MTGNPHDPLTILDGGAAAMVVGRSCDLDAHFERIRPEFNGKPLACFELAKSIVRIRREHELDSSLQQFFELLRPHIGLHCQHLSTRWLIAVCDTLTDHGDPGERPAAMCLTILVNMIKLADSERLVERNRTFCGPENHAALPRYLAEWPHRLWDGVTSYHLKHGDMPANLFSRCDRTLQQAPTVLPIYREILKRLKTHSNLLSRLARLNENFWHPSPTGS